MLSFPAAIKVYLCTVPCDMRRSFDDIAGHLPSARWAKKSADGDLDSPDAYESPT
jgi:hypothetical protein